MQKESLTALVRHHLEKASSASSGRSAHTIYGGHEHALRQTLIALRAGSNLDEHENPGEATLQVLHGRVTLVAGDTECTPEMKALTKIDHAFIPMNLPYTMPPEEAAACVLSFKPAQVTPYHYAGSDLTVFAKALEGATDVKLVQIEAYPGGLPW